MTQDLIPAADLGSSEVTVFDKSNESAVINIVSPGIAQIFQDSLFERPELFDLDEHGLQKKLKEEGKSPSATDNRIRMKFWHEYDRATAQGQKMKMAAVLAGVCSREFFYGQYLKRNEKVAWLLCPPTSYLVKTEESLEYGLEQLREILGYEMHRNGKFDSRLADIKLKIVAMLDARVKGAIVQKSLNIHAQTPGSNVDRAVEENSEQALLKQLNELDRKNRLAQRLPVAEYADIVVEKKEDE